MPKGGNCTMDNFNCAIYDAKGDPGSHRCRALKGVEEDPNCVCNPPSATRSGARCAFRKDRNERRRDARAADKASKPSSPNVPKSPSMEALPKSPSMEALPKSTSSSSVKSNNLSPFSYQSNPSSSISQSNTGGLVQMYKKKLNQSPKPTSSKSPTDSALKKIYAALANKSPSKSASKSKEVDHPYVNISSEQAGIKSPSKTLSLSPNDISSAKAELTALEELKTADSLLSEPVLEKKKRGPSRGSQSVYQKFISNQVSDLKSKGVPAGAANKIALEIWRASKANPKNNDKKSAIPVVATTTVASENNNLQVLPQSKSRLLAGPIKGPHALTTIAEDSQSNQVSPKDAALEGMAEMMKRK